MPVIIKKDTLSSAAPVASAAHASSADASTSAGPAAGRKKSFLSGPLSSLKNAVAGKKNKTTDHAAMPSPPPASPAAPAPEARTLNRQDGRRVRFDIPGRSATENSLDGRDLRRTASAPRQVMRKMSLGDHLGMPLTESSNPAPPPASHVSATSPRTSTDDARSQPDTSPEPVLAQQPDPVTSEIVEEWEIESNATAHSDASEIGPDETPERDSATPHSDTEAVPAGRNASANLLRDAHKVPHQNPYHTSDDTGLLGIRTTTRPGRPMTLPHAGPTPIKPEDPTPAESAAVDAPPLATAETGLKKSKKLKSVRSFVEKFLSTPQRRSQPGNGTQVGTKVEEIVPELTDAASFLARMRSLFPLAAESAGETDSASELTRQICPSQEDLRPDLHSPRLEFTHPMLIAERLAQVCDGDAGRALDAFKALQQGHFLPFRSVELHDSSEPQRLESLLTLPPERASRAQPQLDALRAAAKLATSPIGFEALLRTMQAQLPPNREPHLKRCLEAVAQVETERGAPADLAVHVSTARGAIDTNQSTLAQEVLHIESRALEQVEGNPHASLNASEKAAIFSWDNGFHERGPGTELAKVQGRLAKMSKYVQRASHLQDLRNVRFDRKNIVRSSVKVVDAQARILAMRAQQAIGRKKTPLSGLRKFGAGNNLLLHPDDDVAVLDKHAKAAIDALLKEHNRMYPDPKAFAPKLQDPRSTALPKPVLREALLEHWKSLVDEQNMRPIGNKLDSAALKAIAQRIATRSGVDTEQTRNLIEGHLQRWSGSKLKRQGLKFDRVVSRELTLADLQKWADEIELPTRVQTPLGSEVANGSPPQEAYGRIAAAASEPDAASTSAATALSSPTYLDETEFGTALRKALTVIDSTTARPHDLTPDGLHQFTRMYLREHNWGNPLVASNGGTAGISTASISDAVKWVTEKLSPVSVTPVLDLRISRSATAVLNIGSTTHGGEIFIGTQRQKAASIGVGASASFQLPALKKVLGQATGSAEATPLAIERVKTRGVMVRALRRPKADGTGFDSAAARDELVKFNDLIWSVAKGEHGALNPEQGWELIANQFFDSPTLSIGWQDQEGTTVHHTLAASAGVRVGHSIGSRIAGAFSKSETERAAVNVGFSSDLTTHGSNVRKEQTGRSRLVRANYLWRFQQNMTLGATQVNAPIPLSHPVGADTASMVSGSSQMTRTFALDDRGFNATFRAIVKAGRLSEPYTLREFEERNAKAFVEFIDKPERHAQFSQVFKAAYGLDKGDEAFRNFQEKTKNWAGPGQHYTVRFRIRAEDRDKLDEMAEVAHSIYQSNPDDPLLGKIEQAMKARFEDEDSWIPTQVFALEGQTAREVTGVNLGVQFNAQETVASDRELSAVVVPLPTANRWTRASRDVLPTDPSVRQGTEEHTAGG